MASTSFCAGPVVFLISTRRDKRCLVRPLTENLGHDQITRSPDDSLPPILPPSVSSRPGSRYLVPIFTFQSNHFTQASREREGVSYLYLFGHGRIHHQDGLGRGDDDVGNRGIALGHIWLHQLGRLDMSTCKPSLPSCQQLSGMILTVLEKLPQLVTNYKAQSADALSMGFLFIWLLGDITNLAGI